MKSHFGIWLNSIGTPTQVSDSKHGLWVLLIVGSVGVGLSVVRVLFQWSDDRRRRRIRKAAARGKSWAEARIHKQLPSGDEVLDLQAEAISNLSAEIFEDTPMVPATSEDIFEEPQPLTAVSVERGA